MVEIAANIETAADQAAAGAISYMGSSPLRSGLRP